MMKKETSNVEKLLLEKAHKACLNNVKLIKKSHKCGCFYCLSIYDAGKVKQWIDEGTTGMCPYCGTDTIVPDAAGYRIDEKFLKAMNERWFGVVVE